MEKESAREGYRSAIQMVGIQSKAIWNSFRSLLGANTVIVGLCGALIKFYPQEFSTLTMILTIAGVVVSVAWALITARAYDQYKYWFAWARLYERTALGGDKHMIQLGQLFSSGETVPEVSLRMRWSGRLFRVEWLSYVVVVAFIVVYVYLFFRAG